MPVNKISLFKNVVPTYLPLSGVLVLWEGVNRRFMWILLCGVEVAVATLTQFLVPVLVQLLHPLLKAVWLWGEAQQLLKSTKCHHTVHGRK